MIGIDPAAYRAQQERRCNLVQGMVQALPEKMQHINSPDELTNRAVDPRPGQESRRQIADSDEADDQRDVLGASGVHAVASRLIE